MSEGQDKLREEMMNEIKSEFILVPKKNHLQTTRPSHITYSILDSVIFAIHEKRGHSHEQMRSSYRGSIDGRKLPESRHIYCWMSSRIDDLITWSTMGKHINKDHATAMHGFRQVENWISTDKIFRQHIIDLCEHYINSFSEIDTRKLRKYLTQL